MAKKFKKDYEILHEFADIQDENERIELLKSNSITFLENQSYTTVLPDDEREALEVLEKENFEEAEMLSEEIKELNKKKKELLISHKEAHIILAKGEIEEKGMIFIIEDNENPNQEIRVTEKGVVLARQKKQSHQLNLFKKAM